MILDGCGIDAIDNLWARRVYVGATKSGVLRRWRHHRDQLRTGTHVTRDLMLTLAPLGILSDSMICLLVAAVGEVVRTFSWWITLLVATLIWETAILGISCGI